MLFANLFSHIILFTLSGSNSWLLSLRYFSQPLFYNILLTKYISLTIEISSFGSHQYCYSYLWCSLSTSYSHVYMTFLCIKTRPALVLNYSSFYQLFDLRKLALSELTWCHPHSGYPDDEYLTVKENPQAFLKIPVFESSLMFCHPSCGD